MCRDYTHTHKIERSTGKKQTGVVFINNDTGLFDLYA